MRARHIHGFVASAVVMCAASVLADDPAKQAHAIMHDALLARATRPPVAASSPSGAAQSATTIANEHMSRTGRAQAERAAHQRAAAHGSMRSGAGRPDREIRASGPSAHGGHSTGTGSGSGCQDAAGNWRTMESHPGEWMHDGGTSGGGGVDGGEMPGHDMLTGTSPTRGSAAPKAAPPVSERAPGH